MPIDLSPPSALPLPGWRYLPTRAVVITVEPGVCGCVIGVSMFFMNGAGIRQEFRVRLLCADLN